MNDIITITPEMVEGARCYVPYAEKKLFLDDVAPRCFEALEISASADSGDSALPPMYKENCFAKQRYLAAALIRLYFGMELELEDADGQKWLISLDQFDAWQASQAMNQLERMKGKVAPELRDKIFDLISDYRDLEKKLNTEVFGLLQVMNDPVSRILASLRQTVTPDMLKEAVSQLAETQTELDAYLKAKQEKDSHEDGKL